MTRARIQQAGVSTHTPLHRSTVETGIWAVARIVVKAPDVGTSLSSHARTGRSADALRRRRGVAPAIATVLNILKTIAAAFQRG